MPEDHFFNTLENLEPKCPKCGTKIDWGTTTKYDDKLESHVCMKCSFVFK